MVHSKADLRHEFRQPLLVSSISLRDPGQEWLGAYPARIGSACKSSKVDSMYRSLPRPARHVGRLREWRHSDGSGTKPAKATGPDRVSSGIQPASRQGHQDRPRYPHSCPVCQRIPVWQPPLSCILAILSWALSSKLRVMGIFWRIC